MLLRIYFNTIGWPVALAFRAASPCQTLGEIFFVTKPNTYIRCNDLNFITANHNAQIFYDIRLAKKFYDKIIQGYKRKS